MSFICTMEHGPKNWEIIQQENGKASVCFSGRFQADEVNTDISSDKKIWFHVVEEDTNEPVVDWTLCEVDGNSWTVHTELPAGGLYRAEVGYRRDKTVWKQHLERGLVIHHFGVGDNFLIAGQSNASGTGKGTGDEKADMRVHVLRDSETWDIATHPFDFRYCFQSPFLSFGRKLAARLNYPIGFIQTSEGGSPMKDWLPEEDGRLYHRACEIIKRHNVKVCAILWYQGCTDATMTNSDNYLNRFESLVKHFRKDLGNDKLPFFTFQIGRHTDYAAGENKKQQDIHWSAIREAQRQAAKTISNVYLMTPFDAKMCDGIHNSVPGNIMLGEHLAKQVLHELYGIGLPFNPPDVRKAVMTGDKELTLCFDNISDTVFIYHISGPQLAMRVVDDEGINLIVDAKTDEEKLVLTLSRQPKGNTYISGHWGANFEFNILDMGTQLPMVAFTDVLVED